MLDPERTSHWFSIGPRGLIECDKTVLLQRMGEVSFLFIIKIFIISLNIDCYISIFKILRSLEY